MAKPPTESRIPLFNKPSQPSMYNKLAKSTEKVNEDSNLAALSQLKPRNRYFDELNVRPTRVVNTSEQISPKRSKYTRGLKPPSNKQATSKEQKPRYFPRAVSNETVNVPDLHSTKAAPSFAASTKPASNKRNLLKEKITIPQPLAKPTLGSAFTSGNATFIKVGKSESNSPVKFRFDNDVAKINCELYRQNGEELKTVKHEVFSPTAILSNSVVTEGMTKLPQSLSGNVVKKSKYFSTVADEAASAQLIAQKTHIPSHSDESVDSNKQSLVTLNREEKCYFSPIVPPESDCDAELPHAKVFERYLQKFTNSGLSDNLITGVPCNLQSNIPSSFSSQRDLDEFNQKKESVSNTSKNQRPNVLGLNAKNRCSTAAPDEISSKIIEHLNSSIELGGFYPSLSSTPSHNLITRVTQCLTVGDIGRRVIVSDEKLGLLKFFGSVEFKSGLFCGVALDEPDGLHDGTVQGRRYFSCNPRHGILAPVNKVKLYHGSILTGEELVGMDAKEALMETETIPPAEFTPTPSSTTSSKHFWENSVDNSKSSNLMNNVSSKQNSFECDESLGILTPDQMSDLPDTGDSNLQFNSFVTPQTSDMTYRFESAAVHDATRLSQQFVSMSFLKSMDATEHIDLNVYESDASEDILSRAVCLSKSDPKAQDVSDRTLSPEDLPMDPPSPNQTLKASSSEESKPDLIIMSAGSPGPSSRSLPPAASFITSITSVGSLDTDGYQGDGELSRPASRNTCTSPVAIMQKACTLKMKTSTQDPMTDSDFFTESDADVHDDVAGTSRGGDRRAQVIDGTLYNNTGSANSGGSVNQQHQRCPSFTASINEETESSGVYSDLERKPEEREITLPDNERKEDCSPDASTKTVSSRTEASQVNEAIISTPAPGDASLETTMIENSSQNPTTNGSFVEEAMDVVVETNDTKDVAAMNTSNPANVSTGSSVEGKTSKKTIELKKHTMPKRNVASKIKAMLEAPAHRSVEDVSLETSRRPSASKQPRKGRWDAVMSKIAQGQADEKLKPVRLKEVKSKVFAGIADGLSPGGAPKRKLAENSPAKKENVTPLKSKSRRARTRASSSSSVQPLTSTGGGGKSPASGNSSQRSSLSDVSLGHNANKTPASAHRSSKKQRDVGRSTSPVSDVSTNSTASHLTPAHGLSNNQLQPRLTTPKSGGGAVATTNGGVAKRHPPSGAITSNKRLHLSTSPPVAKSNQDKSVGTPTEMKTPLVRKPTSRRIEKHKLSRDHNRFAGVNKPPVPSSDGVVGVTSSTATPAPTLPTTTTTATTTAASVDALEAAKSRVRQLEASQQSCATGFDAMTAVVAHLVNHFDALSARRLKNELEKMLIARNEAALARDEMSANLARVEEQLANSEAEKLQLVAVNEQCHADIAEIKQAHTAQLSEAANKCDALKEATELKIIRLAELHAADKESLINQLRDEHDSALVQIQTESKKSCEVLEKRLALYEAEYSKAIKDTSDTYDSPPGDKGARLKIVAAKCEVLQIENASLKAVFDLRLVELHDLRIRNDYLYRDREKLQGIERKASALQARVEDLELQLTLKKDENRQLAVDLANLTDRCQHEVNGNKRLSQFNEELSYKLKNKQKVINLLSKSSNVPESSDNSFPRPAERNTKSFSDAVFENEFYSTPSKAEGSQNDSSSPINVSSFYERSDSVSWIFEMDDETPEDAAQKILQKKSASNSKSPIAKRCSAMPHRVLDVDSLETFDMFKPTTSTSTPKTISGPLSSDGRQDYEVRKENGIHEELRGELPRCMTSSESSQSSHDEPEKSLPVLPASSSSDLVLLVTQKPPVPKNAGGEAMVSVETSEEDNSVEPSDDDSSSDIQ